MAITNSKALSKKNLFGYAMGDLGGCMTFALMGSFLTPYYTEVAGLSTGAVAAIFLIIRIWDALNDPMMGTIMDKIFSKTHNRNGKFRPWMLRSTPLLLITSILMFTAPSLANGMAKAVVTFVVYLLYEASYTMFNIPYGSLLSAMSNTDGERASLSSARGFGSLIGNVVPLMIFPLIIEATTENPQFGYTVGITICAVIGFVACMLSYYWTSERNTNAVVDDVTESSEIRFSDILVVFKKNRAYVALCIQGVLFCVAQYMGTTLGIYMYRDVLGALPMMSLMQFITMPLSIISLAVLPKFSGKFGLEATVSGTQLISAALYALLFFLPNNVYIYMAGYAFANAFMSVTVFMQWGMVGEAIDYNEMVTGKRTEGSIYGTFNLMRRIGQAVGSSVAVALLGVVGYIPNAASQTAAVQVWIKALVCLSAAILLVLMFLNLKFVWNITPEIRAKIAQSKQNKEN